MSLDSLVTALCTRMRPFADSPVITDLAYNIDARQYAATFADRPEAVVTFRLKGIEQGTGACRLGDLRRFNPAEFNVREYFPVQILEAVAACESGARSCE